MGNIKGTGWRGMYEYLIKVGGPEGIAKVKAALSMEDQEIFSKPILPITWLDFGAYMRFLLTADKILGKGDMQLIKDANYYNANNDLKGIYKMFISFISPQTILRNAGMVWSRYYDSGKLTVEWERENGLALKLVDFPDIPLYHDVDQAAFMEECFRISGGKNIASTHPKCIARGDDCCIFQFKWS